MAGPAETTNAIDQLKKMLGLDVQTQQNFSNTGDAKLPEIYSQHSSELNSLSGRTGALYGQSSDLERAIYDNAAASQQAALDQSITGVETDAAKLGLQAAVPDSLTKLRTFVGQGSADLAAAKAAGLSNLNTLGTNNQGVAIKAIEDSKRELAGQRAGLQQTVAKNIGDIQKGSQDSLANLAAQLQDLQAQERTSALKQTAGDPLDELRALQIMASIDKTNADTEYTKSKLSGKGGTKKSYPKGIQGLDQYLKAGHFGPKFSSRATTLYRKGSQEGPLTGLDPYATAIDALTNSIKDKSIGGLNPDLLLKALGIAFGK